jgi:lysophospholipase L1-like esterase
MQHILVYADSLSWGIIPDSRNRLAFHERWPGVLEQDLREAGLDVRVTEDCLNGRRTVWDDPFKPGRNALDTVAQVIEAQSPLSLIILMLGTNDYQATHRNNAWLSSQGLKAVVEKIRQAPIEPGMSIPPILIVSSPLITQPKGTIAPKFLGAEERCVGMVEAYREVADETGCVFFDSNSVTTASRVDGIHLDREQHEILGKSLVQVAQGILA